MNENNINNFISKDSIRRLIKDVSEIRKNPLTKDGIYYHHDEEDMLKGYALIIGPPDTPYYGGYYLFELIFPSDYPFSPPKLNYKTNDGMIRFNPNLYTNGKVCLSILNTWHGDPWSSCQTISSILLTLCTILNKQPLLNEPGVNKTHPDLDKYSQIIHFSNISVAICDVVNQKLFIQFQPYFYEIINEYFLKNYDNLITDIDNHIKENATPTLMQTSFYNLRITLDYNLLKQKIIKCKNELINQQSNIFINKIEI